jgi:hypothetical protein
MFRTRAAALAVALAVIFGAILLTSHSTTVTQISAVGAAVATVFAVAIALLPTPQDKVMKLAKRLDIPASSVKRVGKNEIGWGERREYGNGQPYLFHSTISCDEAMYRLKAYNAAMRGREIPVRNYTSDHAHAALEWATNWETNLEDEIRKRQSQRD